MKLSELKITPRRLELLKRMGIQTVEELLRMVPLRYEKIEETSFEQWEKGQSVVFEALIITSANVLRLPNNRTMTRFKVLFQEEELQVTVFNRPWPGQFQVGDRITLFGIYQENNSVTVSTYNHKPLQDQKGIKPVYSIRGEIRQSDIEAVMKKALNYIYILPKRVPVRFLEKYRLMGLEESIRQIHFPTSEKQLNQAIRSLKYEEFLTFQCVLQLSNIGHGKKTPKKIDHEEVQKAIEQLPYTLTVDQKSAIDDILKDMESSKMMYRMVQGDVGCGKTAVAMVVLKACESAGYQAALLAPTEILAKQHFENLKKHGVNCTFLTSSLKVSEKRKALEQIKNKEVMVAVGTHSLFSQKVEFENLGLVIADEQQRFGVKQRRSLLEKGDCTDFLMMSATPIPRTYAHFLYGDIDLSPIHTMPPGRQPVRTQYVPSASMGPILQEVLESIRQGRQLYVVCPAIEDNQETNIRSAKKVYEGMVQLLGRQIQIGLLHGKNKPAEKEEIMNRFASGEIQILVSTTVVEVGIDVPNATMMVIYDAHRFGLSALHQLRGRAARSSIQGQCWLLSSTKDPQARERLKNMEEMLDGFQISEYDLKRRGPGDLLGTRQSGLPSFVLGDHEKDSVMMEYSLRDAREILEQQMDDEMLAYVNEAVKSSAFFD